MCFDFDFDPNFVLFPPMSYGELMDALYLLWIGDGTTKTFEEFQGLTI